MKTSNYRKVWHNNPMMRPAFIMVKNVPRLGGTVTYTAGSLLWGNDDRNGFFCIEGKETGGVRLPLDSVKFIGYVNVNSTREDILQQFEDLRNA